MSDSDKHTSSNWIPPSVTELQAMLPQYEVSALWGRGGMGAVYKGRQKSLHRDVAIKVLPETFASGESDPHQFVERFKLEARSMANLDHPAILSVYDFGQTENGQLYIVMEFIDGMDIFAYLQHHGGKLPHEHAIAICSHVLDALQYAHDSGVIHRDIKPSNVLINTQGRVKLCDFGLAKRIAEDDDEVESGAPMTLPDMAMGTPDFVAPEALEPERQPDGRADLYAVGVMLYQLLTGKLPRGQFKLPAQVVPGLDVRFDDVVSKALQTDPDDRYASATAFRSDLDKILSQPIPKAADPSSAAIPLAELAERSAPKMKVRGNRRQGTPGHTAPVKPEAEVEDGKKSKTPLFIGVGLAAVVLIGIGIYAVTRPGDTEKGPELAAVEPSAPESPVTPEQEPVPSQAPEVKPEPEPPTPEPEKPPATAPATTPEPAEPSKPEPEPEPEPDPSPTPPADPAPAAPEKPEEPKPTESEPPSAQLAAIRGLKSRLDGYLTARREAVETLAASYLRGLDTRMNQAADAGNLKLTKAYRGEKALVEELQQSLKEEITDPMAAVGEGATLPPLADDASEGLVSLRTVWTKERQKIRTDLDGKLQQSLKALESELTKARKLEQAELVLAYREGLDGMPKPAVAAVAEPPKPSTPDPASATNTAMASHRATKDKPFVNSLGMRFVPVPITGGPSDGKLILFSIWETRVKDFEAFLRDDRKRQWSKAIFLDDDHPAATTNREDALAFCDWLSEKDRKEGLLGENEFYKLPSDHEWSCAVGIGGKENGDTSPDEKKYKIEDVYPWGSQWPPPTGAGNFYGKETKTNLHDSHEPLAEYEDDFDRTAPVGSFAANAFGLYDLAGNVSEWCQDGFGRPGQDSQLQRGGSWASYERTQFLSSGRVSAKPGRTSFAVGFRVVLDNGVAAPVAPTSVTQTPPVPATPRIDRGALKLASKERPFVNSLGMKFVPVPGTDVLFCIHETRWKDYAGYAAENSDIDPTWKNQNHGGFTISERPEEHPVVSVNWNDAKAFCEWISRMEGIAYRLPADQEWSEAVGLGRKEKWKRDDTPATVEKSQSEFPWGTEWPPPKDAGNYSDQSRKAKASDSTSQYLDGFDDGFPTTAPVMSFEANGLGLYDLGGNVWEWCEDWSSEAQEKRALRGGSWINGTLEYLLSSCRGNYAPVKRNGHYGFRVVIDPNAEVPATPQAATIPTWSPAVIKAALEKKPGRLYGFGNAKGKPVSVATVSKTNDFVQVTTRNNYGWIALRANGETLTDADEEPLDFDRKIEKLGGGQQGSLPGIFGIDGRGTVHITQVSAGFGPESEVARQLRNVIDIESNPDGANAYHGLALKSDGSVVYWGPIYTRAGAKPPPQEALTAVKAIATYYAQCWAVKSDGSVISWMAGGDRVDIPPEIKGIREMAADGQFCIALTEEAKVLAWGRNYKGWTDVPEDLGKCIAIRIGGYAAAAQKEDGSWVAWGDGDDHVKKINSLGPVTDLDFVGSSGQKTDFVLWIKADVDE